MLKLNTIKAQPGSVTSKKRLGRGSGSGLGATAGKGDKGQLARSGGHVRPGFEGGQMPLYRRIPKRGFTSMTKRVTALLNISDLANFAKNGIKEISLEALSAAGLLKGRAERLTVLAVGEITKPLTVKAHKVSPAAQEKITKAGGKIELIAIPAPKGKPKKKQRKA